MPRLHLITGSHTAPAVLLRPTKLRECIETECETKVGFDRGAPPPLSPFSIVFEAFRTPTPEARNRAARYWRSESPGRRRCCLYSISFVIYHEICERRLFSTRREETAFAGPVTLLSVQSRSRPIDLNISDINAGTRPLVSSEFHFSSANRCLFWCEKGSGGHACCLTNVSCFSPLREITFGRWWGRGWKGVWQKSIRYSHEAI